MRLPPRCRPRAHDGRIYCRCPVSYQSRPAGLTTPPSQITFVIVPPTTGYLIRACLPGLLPYRLLDKATPTATVCFFFFANDELQSAKCLVLRSLTHGGLCRWHALAGEVKWQHPRLFLLRSCDPVRQVALLVSRRLLAVAAYGGLRPSS